MPAPWIERLTPFLKLDPPADPDELARCEAKIGRRLPEDLADFLRIANGGVGSFPNAYVQCWSADRLAEHYRSFMTEFYPRFLAFGSDGGGEMLAFDSSGRVVVLPYIGLEEDAIARASSLRELLEALGRGESLFLPPT